MEKVGRVVKDKTGHVMNEKELAQHTRRLREIATEKKPGIVIVLEISEKKMGTKTRMTLSGCVLAQGTSRRVILKVLSDTLGSMGITPFELMSVDLL